MTVTPVAAPPFLASKLAAYQLELIETIAQTHEVAKFCSINAAQIDRNGVFPEREFELIANAGLLTAPLRRELGGLGLGIDASSIGELLTILQAIGRGNLAVGRIYEGHVNAVQLLQTFGTPAQIETYARDIRDRRKLMGVWNAEAEDGVKIMPLGGGKYRLEGAKTFATGCGCVERPFIGGALPGGEWQLCRSEERRVGKEC